jgi:predicted RNase H-like nuclease
LRLLTAWRADVLDALAAAPSESRLDDALDALVCAWVAQRWVAGASVVLGDGARDARGLVMRIVC